MAENRENTIDSHQVDRNAALDWQGPRTIIVPRADNGFGFTLRHFIVYPPESARHSPYSSEETDESDTEGGKRKRSKISALEPMDTIFVKQVKEDGPAYHAGLHTGDRIVSVNGEPVTGKSYSQVIALIQASDSSLKLLVVPKDEDILQMAYQNSAYNQGQVPYRGHASEIPSPPQTQFPCREVNQVQKSESMLQGKPPVAPRYKSEIKLMPEDNNGTGRARKYSDQPGARTSVGSIGSISSSSSGREPMPVPLDNSGEKTSPDDSSLQNMESNKLNNVTNVMSGNTKRTSSHSINLKRPESQRSSLENVSRIRDGSMERRRHTGADYGPPIYVRRSQDRQSNENLSRHYDSDSVRSSLENIPTRVRKSRSKENLRHSSDDLVSDGKHNVPMAKSLTAGRLSSSTPSSHKPYVRAQTTSSLFNKSGKHGNQDSDHQHSSRPTSMPSSRDSWNFTVTTHPETNLVSHSSNRRSAPVSGYGPQPFHCQNQESFDSTDSELQVSYGGDGGNLGQRSEDGDRTYGAAFSVRIHDGAMGDMSKSNSAGFERQSARQSPSLTITSHSKPITDRQINLVTERMKKFEHTDSTDSNGSGKENYKYKGDINRISRHGCESVANRAALFERRFDSEDNLSGDDNLYPSRRQQIGSHSPSPARTCAPPPEITKVPPTPPATINIYFRADAPANQSVTIQPSPERHLVPMHVHQYSDSSDSRSTGSHSPIPMYGEVQGEGQTSPGKKRPARRQPSYLTAVNSPGGQKDHHYSRQANQHHSPNPHAYVDPPSYKRPLPTQNYPESEGLQWHSQNAGLHLGPRAYSRQATVPIPEGMPASCSITSSDTPTSTVSNLVTLRQKNDSEEDKEAKLRRRRSYLMATGKDRPQINVPLSHSDSTLQPLAPSSPNPEQEEVVKQSRAKLELQIPEPVDPASQEATTPTKQSNIKKLKAFFGEKTPRIVETISDRQRIFDMPSPSGMGHIIKEGPLSVKFALEDGKRTGDRSWKPFWIVLRGHALYLYKDKASVSMSPTFMDDPPISIKSCMVDIAHNYTKKKHVFELTTYNGSQYMFQADDHISMLSWIRFIQTYRNPDGDKMSIFNTELILRKSANLEHNFKTSPQMGQKMVKKVSAKSLRSKSPGSHSPGVKQKAKSFEKEHSDSPKSKDSKSWRGKFKKFKRYGSSSSAPSIDVLQQTGTFGVPLDACLPGDHEFVPLIVEVCCKLVEENGIDNQGIYRVPGNKGAVTMLQEELNKEPDGIDLADERWSEVNVVSSLLKSFFRELPEPLVTEDVYDSIIAANRVPNPEKRMLRIKKLLHELPEHNFETFRFLAEHLNKIANNGEMNKMDARNLAIVFGPTLVRAAGESMISMVKDMSDQCRIVESVILHYDWFFSSWDVDDHVPIDDYKPDAMQISSMNQALLTKAEHLELGDRGRETSAKDLVSSIISAANKKIKRKDKERNKSGGDTCSIESDLPSTEGAYSERNIDAEIELRKIKESSQENITKDSMTNVKSLVMKSESSDRVFSSKMMMMESRSTPDNSITSNRDGDMQYELTRYPAYPAPDFSKSRSTENVTPRPMILRKYADDVDTGRGHDEVGHMPMSGSGGLTHKAQQHLKRIEMETKALRKKEEEQRVEQEKRAVEKQRIEMEFEKTRKELENEDSIEEMLAKPREIAAKMPENSSKMSDYGSKAETTSLTSEYSTTSSLADGRLFSSLPYSQTHTSDYSSNPSPSSSYSWRKGSPLDITPPRYPSSERSRFFMISNNQGDGYHNKKHSTKDDIELYRQNSSDASNVQRTPLRRRQDSQTSTATDSPDDPKGKKTLVSLRRKGSLDSLLDSYDKSEPTFMSSDSEQGDEVLGNLATTFDQKLKHLLDPTVEQSNERQLSQTYASPGRINLDHGYARPRTSDKVQDIKKSQRSDPKVGIASRFERSKDTPQSLLSGSLSPSHQHSAGKIPRSASMSSNRMGKGMVKSSSGTSMSTLDANRITKDFKELRLRGHSASRERLSDNNDQINKSPEKITKSPPKSQSVMSSSEKLYAASKARSVSPPPRMRDPLERKKMREKRRHTVGGTKDSEHIKALQSLHQPNSQGMESLSAWERLQPAVKSPCKEQSVFDWLQQERLRNAGSSPAILDEPDQHDIHQVRYENRRGTMGDLPSLERNRHTAKGEVRVRQTPPRPGHQRARAFPFESAI